MPTTTIVYMRRKRSEDVREWNINETPDTEEIAREEIQHDSYDDLRRKIRERLKQLLRLDSFDSEPLYDLSCVYFREVPTGDVLRRFSEYFTQDVYNTIDWDLPEQIRARLEAVYYTLQGPEYDSSVSGTNPDASSDALDVTNSSGDTSLLLGYVLKRLDNVLSRLDI